jgi:ligand-binding sensor domain-containing protein
MAKEWWKCCIFLLANKAFLLRSPRCYIILSFLFVCINTKSRAQHLSFQHLGIAEGMPSNVTGHACFDSTGFAWIATNDGLISYDGTRIRQYLRETHPGLPRNEIGFLFCDSRNRVWVCTNEGLAVLNEQRRIIPVIIHDSLARANIDFCFEVRGLGMIATGSGKTYLLAEGKKTWERLSWFDEKIRKGGGLSNIRPYNKSSYMFVMRGRAMLVDFIAQKVIVDLPIKNISSVAKLNDRELVATTSDEFTLFRIAVGSNEITKQYSNARDNQGRLIETSTVSSCKGSNGMIYLTTRSYGLIGFDPEREIFYAYRHEPLSTTSISSDILRWVFCHANGYMLVTSSRGLNYTNVLPEVFLQKNNFQDEQGVIMDGGVTGVAEGEQGQIWIKSLNNLFIWNERTNRSKNISINSSLLPGIESNTEAAQITRDVSGNMWVTYNGKGLAKFAPNGRLIKFLDRSSSPLPTNAIRITRQLANGMLIVGAENRLFLLHPQTYQVDSFEQHPALKTIARRRIIDIMPDGEDIWVAISPGGAVYRYNWTTKILKEFRKADGLSSERVYCLAKDQLGNVYAGTYDGLNIIDSNGKIRVISKHNGLRHPRVENLVADKYGKLWVTNFNSLLCYDPLKDTFAYFDERNGVSNAGFSVVGNAQTKDGRILFSNGGLLVVDPSSARFHQANDPAVAVHRLYDDGGYELLNTRDTIKLRFDQAKLSLYYLSNTLITANRFFYRYKMERLDTGWQQPTKNNQVTYNLSPGRYHFLIQASYNEGGWRENTNRITIIVSPPWWQEWWFRALVTALVAVLIILLFRRRVASIKAKSVIRQQMAELEAKALRAQMNPHFIFNCLNAIQELIVTENHTASYQYLSKFSKLLRLVLNNSEKNFIPLSSEIEMNQLYLELESLRFKQSFHYSIQVDEQTDPESTLFPSLLLQPFIENAIWHGLMHKEGEKKLAVSFSTAGQMLSCVIEDNGIGRARAAQIKSQKLGAHHFVSKGTELAQQRVEILKQTGLATASIETKDIVNAAGDVSGTRVEISIPLYKNVNATT